MQIVNLPKIVNYGKLVLNVYDFDKMDQILPMHNHISGGEHISIVARGSFLVKGENWNNVLKTGDIVDWEKHINHEFLALEDNSRLVNIMK
jgi:quercetin dioxygenase-like cupin family protein